MNKLLFCCALFVAINYGHASYTDCGSVEGTLTAINVTDCDNNASRCVLHRNTNATIQIVFVPIFQDVTPADLQRNSKIEFSNWLRLHETRTLILVRVRRMQESSRNDNCVVEISQKFGAITIVLEENQAKEAVDTVKAVVHGVILDIDIPFNLPNPNGCQNSGLTCPLKPGQIYTYETTLPILKKYPRVTVDVKFELQNSDQKDITCGLIPSKIQ